MTEIFLDTDVIIDYITDRKPFSEDSAVIFSLIEQKKVKGFASALSFSNMYYVLRKFSSQRHVISTLMALTGFLYILKVDEQAIKSALSSPFKDIEDAIQYYSALTNKRISIIITRNTRDYSVSDLAVMTPETFLRTFVDKI